ncbi:DNA repair protein RecN [Nanchangia anserum]|uniref:DNA repair protein RecN n=1 Tax=Nanchangia anserum TaxID=2692125 RepID=A0A8I0G6D4_9ACTO|nr:DNA repair protein RecN [Nanchangia anserum]MBD3688635.1 DNA repair protein RecN [Nanchangia anserum]QOX82396.1 DNA repair protein RecN [Nanchangia anserum]
MIEDIDIRNLGVIEHAHLRPGPGLTVLTGETGAGKTMVLTSIGLLMGKKADTGHVRHGEDVCGVDGVFTEPAGGPAHEVVASAGGYTDDDEVILGRTVPRQGRSRAVAGGRSVPAGILAEVGAHLVTVHGQTDQLALRSAGEQRRLLDDAGDAEHARLVQTYRQAWRDWSAAREAAEQARASEADREREMAALQAGLDVLHDLDPAPGEDDVLVGEIDRLANVEDLRIAATTAHAALSDPGDMGADCLSVLGEAQRGLERVSDLDAELGEYAASLRSSALVLQDVATSLASYLDDLSADPRLLEAKQQRLADLRRGLAPYATDVSDFLEWGTRARERVAQLADPDHSVEAYDQAERDARERLETVAAELTQSRRAIASELVDDVTDELASLAMTGAGFVIEVAPGNLTAAGGDEVNFGLTDPEGRVRPLGSGASGGELSRIMLALEAALIDRRDPVGRPTLIFDEVDAGIGGATASAVGSRLARLAERYQVIVVTHLAQVAAYASTHLVVTRTGTTTSLRDVTGDERVGEIARMLSGETDSDVARAHAAELLSSRVMA